MTGSGQLRQGAAESAMSAPDLKPESTAAKANVRARMSASLPEAAQRFAEPIYG